MTWDLRLLRSFVALAEAGNVGRAAVRLHVSQPALSRQIKNLERTWGVTLFARHARGVTPTAAAEPLLARARALLDEADGLDSLATKLGRETEQTLNIGFIGQALNEYTAPLVRMFRSEHPAARLQLRQYDMRDMSAGLLSGETDLGILRGPSSIPGLVHHEILREPRVAVLREDDPLARHTDITLGDMLDRRWVVSANPDPTYQDFALANHARQGRPALTGPVVASVDEYLEAVLDGSAIGLAPESATRYYTRPGVTYRRVRDAAPSCVTLSHRDAVGEPSPLAQDFLDLARANVPEQPEQPHSSSTGTPG